MTVAAPSTRLFTLQGRRLLFLAGDIGLLLLSLAAAAWLRFDGRVPPELLAQLPLAAALSLVVKIPIFASQRLYARSWDQIGLEDMLAVFRAVTLGSAAFWVVVFVLKQTGALAGFPRAVLLLDYVLTLHAVGAFRIGRRVYQHVARPSAADARRALIIGAGAAGGQLARSLRETPYSGYAPVGFLDDDSQTHGTLIQGLPVLGGRDRLGTIARERGIEAILIAMPSAPAGTIRSIVSAAREAGVGEIRIIPGLARLLNEPVSFSDLRELQLADLLGREMVQVDMAGVERWLRGRRVLVTGAGGSIGSELCRQIARFRPAEIVLLDRDETGLFWIEQDLRKLASPTSTVLADIREPARLAELFPRVRPQVVFHAAAYKHVGLMERHPEEAVVTNILGTLAVAEASLRAGVEKFVLISTDKAVNPTSIMGATKRVAEQICLALQGSGRTQFLAVRFGNVLGSRGSVVPLFQDSLRRGEAITVRGPNTRRYFMATAEAVLLVLQAGAMGAGGETFVLDMGEPIRILDLAREVIRLSGLDPDDVPIVVTEPEPGEKEAEDLLTAEEGTSATRHDRIFAARVTPTMPRDELLAKVAALQQMVQDRDLAGIVATLQTLVPTYRPSELLLARVGVGPSAGRRRDFSV